MNNEYPEKSKYFPYESFRRYVKGRVLEIGCAEGNNTRFLKNKYNIPDRKMFCIELDMERLKKAKNRTNAFLVNADARHLPFKKNTFDFVYCSEVIEHMPSRKDHSVVIDGIIDILKPERHCIITTPNKWLYRLFLILAFRRNDPTHKSELNYGEFRRLIDRKFDKSTILGIFGVFGRLNIFKNPLMGHPGMCKALVAICYKG